MMDLKTTYIAYYYDYMLFLHRCFHIEHWEYKWINLLENKFECPIQVDPSMFINLNNSFLDEANNNKKLLGLNILENGMYFPFISLKDKEKGNIQCLFGKHRLYSLLLNSTKLNNKKFLFLKTPYLNMYEFNEKDYLICKIKCPYIKRGQINYKDTKNHIELINYFLSFSDSLPNHIYLYRDKIKPNPIFNNEKLFKEFIENPFNISLKRIQKEAEAL